MVSLVCQCCRDVSVCLYAPGCCQLFLLPIMAAYVCLWGLRWWCGQPGDSRITAISLIPAEVNKCNTKPLQSRYKWRECVSLHLQLNIKYVTVFQLKNWVRGDVHKVSWKKTIVSSVTCCFSKHCSKIEAKSAVGADSRLFTGTYSFTASCLGRRNKFCTSVLSLQTGYHFQSSKTLNECVALWSPAESDPKLTFCQETANESVFHRYALVTMHEKTCGATLTAAASWQRCRQTQVHWMQHQQRVWRWQGCFCQSSILILITCLRLNHHLTAWVNLSNLITWH